MADFDINPAALSSRPSISVSTPVLSNKSITVSSLQKPKTSQLIPSRIDLEPIYTKLKACIAPEHWTTYKEATTQFLVGTILPHRSYDASCSSRLLHAPASLVTLTDLFPGCCRSLKPSRVQREDRPDTRIGNWREGAPPQPADSCDIRQCHEGDAGPGPCALGQRKR